MKVKNVSKGQVTIVKENGERVELGKAKTIELDTKPKNLRELGNQVRVGQVLHG